MAVEERIDVRIVDQAGGNVKNASLPADVSMSNLVPAVANKLGLQVGEIRYYFEHKETGKRLGDNDTLIDAGVRDGDTLRLMPNVTAGGGLTVNAYQDFLVIDAYLNQLLVLQHMNFRALYAVFLYTAGDKSLSTFIKDNFLELHYLSGEHCYFYIVERPKPEWLPAIRDELASELGSQSRNFKQIWKQLEAGQFEPADSAAVDAIRQRLGVNRSQLPCAIFFTELDTQMVLVVPFERLLGYPVREADSEALLSMFRELFDKVEVATLKPLPERLETLQKAIGPGARARNEQHQVYSTIGRTFLTESVKVAIATVAARLLS